MPEDLDDLAEALADGEAIDWRAAHARQTSPDSRSVVEGLESISRLSSLTPGPARPSRRLPLLLEGARILAALSCAAGLIGFISSWQSRDAVMVGILCTFAGSAVFLDAGGRDRRARALAACFWTTAAAFSSRGLRELVQAWPASIVPHALLSARPDAFFALAVWQFARDFPNVTRFGSVDIVCAWGIRAATVIGVLLFATGVMSLVAPDSAVALTLTSRRDANPAELVYAVLLFGSAFVALGVIAWRSRLSEGVERLRVRLFLYTIVVAFTPILTLILMTIAASILRPGLVRAAQASRWSSWLVYPPMFLLPIATAYAVAAHDVLNVRLVIQRGLRYLLARWLLLWGALVPSGLLLGHLYRHADLTLGVALTTKPAPVLLWFAGVGAIVLAFRGTLIRALDQWVLPGVEQPAVALASMAERMKQARTPLEVAATLADAIEPAMQAPAAAYSFIGGAVVPAAGGEPVLPVESAIPPLLEGAREPAIVSPTHRRSYYSLLLDTDRRWIDRHQIEILVPLLPGRAGSSLLGFVTLSSRRNALGFSEDDLRFVRVATAAASLACDAIGSDGRRADDAADSVTEEIALQCVRCGRVEDRQTAAASCDCGGAWEPAALPKRVLGRFELREWLGAGGMGVVYRASDLSLDRDVALKTLPKLSHLAAERLMTEARTMASLSHEDVAVVYGLEQWRGTPLLAMEYLAGGTLAARLRRAPLSEADVVALVRHLARSLARVHARGLYHGDIKPSNIGFTSSGAPKLLDFGLARALSLDGGAAHLEEPGAERAPLGGTWAYLPLEVRDGAAPGPGLDLWALGVVLCEALIGTHPFPKARTRYEMSAGLLGARARLRAERSPAHERVVASMLSIEPAARPTTAAAFERLLEDL
ncbi:MAG TPA: serine/threonine-protein kinase [Vicinamibacterales bacterium]|nr:serine/threonine-protein kinase [Vicinamibacterales bacterium]